MGPQSSICIWDGISHIPSAVLQLLCYNLGTAPTEQGFSLAITVFSSFMPWSTQASQLLPGTSHQCFSCLQWNMDQTEGSHLFCVLKSRLTTASSQCLTNIANQYPPKPEQAGKILGDLRAWLLPSHMLDSNGQEFMHSHRGSESRDGAAITFSKVVVQLHLLDTNRNRTALANSGIELEARNCRCVQAVKGAQKRNRDDSGQQGKLLCSHCQTTCFAVYILHQQHSSPPQALQKHLNFLFPDFIYFSSLLHTLPHTQTTGINYYVGSSCTSLDIMATKTLLTVLVMDAAKLELAPKQKNTYKSYLRSCSTLEIMNWFHTAEMG